jgi:hypothetical protein
VPRASTDDARRSFVNRPLAYDGFVAQPTFVPVPDTDRVRPSIPAPIPTKPRTNRPGELRSPTVPHGKGVGATGPDQGYALSLASRLAPRLRLADGEDRHDVARGIALLGSRRAALGGRAPCSYDLEAAASLFGYLGDAPEDLVAYRRPLFKGVCHSYESQRALVDSVTDDVLGRAGTATYELASWRERLVAAG